MFIWTVHISIYTMTYVRLVQLVVGSISFKRMSLNNITTVYIVRNVINYIYIESLAP